MMNGQKCIFKNWHPLIILNCTSKFFSAILANQLKSTLETGIKPEQTGFIANRSVGDNT